MSSNKYYVYKLILKDKNNKFYIGSTHSPKVRKSRHYSELAKGAHHNIYLQEAFDKIGRNKGLLEFRIISEHDTEADAQNEEERLINETYDINYNISKHSKGGDNISYHPNNKEIRKLQSKLVSERYKKMTPEERLQLSLRGLGDKNPNYKTGVWSKEYLQNIKENNIKLVKEKGLKNINSLSKYRKEPWNKLSNEKIIERRKIIGDSVIYCEGYLFPDLMYAEYIYDVDLSSRILSNKLGSKEFRIATPEDLVKHPYYDITKHSIKRRNREEGMFLRTVMVVWDDILFRSLEEAAEAFDVSDQGIKLRIKSKSELFNKFREATEDDINNLKFYEKSRDYNRILAERERMLNLKRVSCKGKLYDSIKAAAEDLGIKHSTLCWRIQSNKKEFEDYFYIIKRNV